MKKTLRDLCNEVGKFSEANPGVTIFMVGVDKADKTSVSFVYGSPRNLVEGIGAAVSSAPLIASVLTEAITFSESNQQESHEKTDD